MYRQFHVKIPPDPPEVSSGLALGLELVGAAGVSTVCRLGRCSRLQKSVPIRVMLKYAGEDSEEGISVSTGPGPGPGPLRSNISSVQSQNIFGPDLIHV